MTILKNWHVRSTLAAVVTMGILSGNQAEGASEISQQNAKAQAVAEQPDLTNEDCTYYIKKNGMMVTVDVNNIGAGISGKSEVELWFSYNDDNTELSFLKRYKLKKLKPGKAKTLKYKVKDRATWDNAYLYVWIDGPNLVSETDETNNYWYWGPF